MLKLNSTNAGNGSIVDAYQQWWLRRRLLRRAFPLPHQDRHRRGIESWSWAEERVVVALVVAAKKLELDDTGAAVAVAAARSMVYHGRGGG
jgi:DNA-binding GntR family transcriptional regulator